VEKRLAQARLSRVPYQCGSDYTVLPANLEDVDIHGAWAEIIVIRTISMALRLTEQ
jgi:hypothetical protein